MSMNEEYFVLIANEKVGPFSKRQLKEMVASKELRPEALCCEGDGDWLYLSQVVQEPIVWATDIEAAKPKKKASAGRVAGLGCLVLVALFILIPLVAGLFGGGEHDYSPSQSDLMEAAHNEVLRYLKAPSTARFNASSESLYRLNGLSNEYLATVVVDAQNSFGAMIRGSYEVRIVANGASLTATIMPQ